MVLPEDAEVDDVKADSRQGDRKQPAVLEDTQGQVPQVASATQGAEHHENAPYQDGAAADQSQVGQKAVGRIVRL